MFVATAIFVSHFHFTNGGSSFSLLFSVFYFLAQFWHMMRTSPVKLSLLSRLVMFVLLHPLLSYPQLPPFVPRPMSSFGMDPIMPANFPFEGFPRHLSPSGTLSSPPSSSMGNNSPFFVGRTVGGDFVPTSAHSPMNSLFIRNSPYQMPVPIMDGGTIPISQQMAAEGQPLHQPIFPTGMANYKNGIGPASAMLPSDIPMDVLVGRQITQHRLDEMNSQSMGSSAAGVGARGGHPFPLSPFLGGLDGSRGMTAPFGGVPFAADSSLATRGGMTPQNGLDSSLAQLMSQTVPVAQNIAPPAAPLPQSAAINAKMTTSDPNSSALPAFLRGAPQEQIDEFKRIIRQPNGTYGEQIRLIDALVQRMEPKRQMMYREFMHENDEREQLHRDRVHKTVAEMSDKAQEQFAKISATLRNPNIPDQERWDRVLHQYEKMEPELRDEFEQKFKGFPTLSTGGTPLNA